MAVPAEPKLERLLDVAGVVAHLLDSSSSSCRLRESISSWYLSLTASASGFDFR